MYFFAAVVYSTPIMQFSKTSSSLFVSPFPLTSSNLNSVELDFHVKEFFMLIFIVVVVVFSHVSSKSAVPASCSLLAT